MRRLVRHPALRGVLPGLACAVAAALVAMWPPARGLDDWLFDGCFAARDAIRGPRPTTTSVVLITLAEEDLDAFEKPVVFISPELGEVVTHARAQGAKAVGLDLMIPGSLSATEKVVRDPLGPASALGRNKALSFHLDISDARFCEQVPELETLPLLGVPFLDETVLYHRPTQTLLGADVVLRACAKPVHGCVCPV